MTVKTSLGTYCAEKVIITAGPWIARFLPRASRITIGSSLRRLVQATDLQGLPLIVRFVIPNKVMGMLALLAGILILIGR